MSDITFPTLSRIPRDLRFGVIWNTQVFSSPLTQSVQTIEIVGARWQASFSLSDREEADTVLIQAHLMKLRGRANRSLIYNFARPTPRGTIAGTPLVNGASQTGAALAIDGCTVGTTLLAGDFIGVAVGSGTELKMVTADATANGSGEMTLAIEPPLRASPSDNAAITTTRPTARFMLTSDDVQWLTKPGVRTDVELSFVEVFA